MKTIRLLAACAPLVAMMLACGSGVAPEAETRESQADQEARPAAVAAEPVEPAEPEPDERLVDTIASFVNDDLVECVDFHFEAWAPDPRPEGWDARLPETDSMAEAEGNLRVRRPCTEQFADRPHLAHCFVESDEARVREDGTRIRGSIRSYFFYAGVLDSDRRMRECIEMGGDWWRVEADSMEAVDARLRGIRRRTGR